MILNLKKSVESTANVQGTEYSRYNSTDDYFRLNSRIIVLFLSNCFFLNPLCAAETENPLLYDLPSCSKLQFRQFGSDQINAIRKNAELFFEADYVETTLDQNYYLNGNVYLKRADQELTANEVKYDEIKQIVDADGNVSYTSNGIITSSDHINLQMNSNQGFWTDVDYEVSYRGSRGSAKSVVMQDKMHSKYKDVSYTTCAKKDTAWELKAKTLKIDQQEGVGTAKHAWINFRDVPFIYTPIISFPIDHRRKSGFLVPKFSYKSDSGVDVSVPYYLNLAPNYDWVLTPRYMSQRGLMVENEFRYLALQQTGTVHFNYIPKDKKVDDDRSYLSYQNKGTLGSKITTSINYNLVSDDQYFEDFGNRINLTSIQHLQQKVDLQYSESDWFLRGRLENFQTIDSTIAKNSRPYRRLPQLFFNYKNVKADSILTYQLISEAVNFDHDTNVKGLRFNVKPTIGAQLRSLYGFFIPKLSLQYTHYTLQTPQNSLQQEEIDRTVPIVSLDSGLIFDRYFSWQKQRMLQTLEPRIFLLYVPEKRQSDIPVFDTSEFDFSFAQLFRENRFNGVDRIGDAKQVSVALTSRFILEDTGREFLRVSVGETFFQQDRQVTLSGNSIATNSSSSTIVELDSWLSKKMNINSTLQYNREQQITEKGTVQFRYSSHKNKIFNMAYRYRKNELMQTDLSMIWPLTHHWNSILKWNYSLKENESIESMAGLEYNHCCWRVRLVANEILKDDVENQGNKKDLNFFMQIQLKGMGYLGDAIDTLLKRSIAGF